MANVIAERMRIERDLWFDKTFDPEDDAGVVDGVTLRAKEILETEDVSFSEAIDKAIEGFKSPVVKKDKTVEELWDET
jgi:hypothetical protein